MQEERYLIGEVARMYRISADAVRYYDKVGLLGPSRSFNNYRSFDLHQISSLHSVLLLRSFGVPIKTIQDFVDSADVSVVGEALDAARAQINSEMKQLETTLGRLNVVSAQLQEFRRWGSEVRLRSSPTWWRLSVATSSDLRELVAMFKRVEWPPESSPCFAFFIDRKSLESHRFQYTEYGILLDRPVEGLTFSEIPSRPCAYLSFTGPMNTGSNDGARAYERIMSWVADAGYEIAGDAVERFVISSHVSYLLEMWVPVSTAAKGGATSARL